MPEKKDPEKRGDVQTEKAKENRQETEERVQQENSSQDRGASSRDKKQPR